MGFIGYRSPKRADHGSDTVTKASAVFKVFFSRRTRSRCDPCRGWPRFCVHKSLKSAIQGQRSNPLALAPMMWQVSGGDVVRTASTWAFLANSATASDANGIQPLAGSGYVSHHFSQSITFV